MMPCKSCGLEHSPMIRCEVARNLLGRAKEQKRVVGTEVEKEAAAQVSQAARPEPGGPSKATGHVPVSAAKRWDKAAYNAYMREYMRKWRAKR